MLSGNGRHRRPRQAPALVVAAGVTGSAIAIPLLGATGAHAADGTAWDRVAECETGGAWSQNSGNGYYGGLQLSQNDWEAYGGLAYAPSPDEASRSQQIRVAESLLADRGIAAWPTCGPLAGLGGGSSAADTASGTADDDASDETPATDSAGSSGSGRTTGASPSPRTTATPDASSPSATPSTESDKSRKSGTGKKTAKSDTSPESEKTTSGTGDTATTKRDDSDNSGRTDAASRLTGTGTTGTTDTGTTGTGTGRHRGGTADEDAADGRTAGRHATRGDGVAREVQDGSYTVRTGDSLWGIADSLELSGGWHSLYAENKETVGADPDHILPGQKLAVGVESGEK
ncbi:transglycosylase family protein [Streptomyces fumanus]|uniref:Peptidoglycan-binding protein LysM n=1 Tax=Streptomyces fumanus TaxID=67302 RepID=A0A919E2S5_9ACTN|nr:transglycosylase family protein [Streptomyces fumanus]GHF04976.1 peptidoglycan-binding protein LysM [Streptomyces fumanus]